MVKALIIIDMVQAYAKDIYPHRNIIGNQLKLIKAFKGKGLPVIAAIPQAKKKDEKNPIMLYLWGDEFKGEENRKPGHKLCDLIPELQKVVFDKIVGKPEYSAFYKTDLEGYCRKNRITELYLCGVWSGVCVHYTGVDAAYRKIWPILVTDASAAPTKKRHKVNCKDFVEVVGKVATTKDVLKGLSAK